MQCSLNEHTHAPGTKITLQATQTGLMDRLDAQNRGVVLLHAELHAPTEKNAMACAQQNRQKQTKLKAGMQGGGVGSAPGAEDEAPTAGGIDDGAAMCSARFPARGELVLLATNEVAPRRNLRLKRTAQKQHADMWGESREFVAIHDVRPSSETTRDCGGSKLWTVKFRPPRCNSRALRFNHK